MSSAKPASLAASERCLTERLGLTLCQSFDSSFSPASIFHVSSSSSAQRSLFVNALSITTEADKEHKAFRVKERSPRIYSSLRLLTAGGGAEPGGNALWSGASPAPAGTSRRLRAGGRRSAPPSAPAGTPRCRRSWCRCHWIKNSLFPSPPPGPAPAAAAPCPGPAAFHPHCPRPPAVRRQAGGMQRAALFGGGDAQMAAGDLGELLVPYMPTIRVPKSGDRVYKTECAFSYDSPVSAAAPSLPDSSAGCGAAPSRPACPSAPPPAAAPSPQPPLAGVAPGPAPPDLLVAAGMCLRSRCSEITLFKRSWGCVQNRCSTWSWGFPAVIERSVLMSKWRQPERNERRLGDFCIFSPALFGNSF